MATKEYTSISNYYRTFSGTDTLAFIMLPGIMPIVLGSVTTISYSMFRNKKPVINIGRTNINGVTRGSRIYAGTMVFTLINQHWIRDIQEAGTEVKQNNDGTERWFAYDTWLAKIKDLKADELPLFDIMLVSANEYGSAVTMYIYGIDFTDEGQTLSVEDLFTENTFSFIARDVSTFKRFDPLTGVVKAHGGIQNVYAGISQKFHVLDSSDTSLDDLAALENEFVMNEIQNKYTYKEMRYLPEGELKYSTTKLMISGTVAEIQEMLNNIGHPYELDVNGVFDEHMDQVIRIFQSNNGLDVTGIVDIRTYNAIVNKSNEEGTDERTAVVVNKNGALVYQRPSTFSNVVDTKPYNTTVNILEIVSNEDEGPFMEFYKTKTGYVDVTDMYSSLYEAGVIEFPTLKYNSQGNYVKMAQSMLSIIFPNYNNISGVFDQEMKILIKQLQKQNNLLETGEINYETWLILKSLSGSKNTASDDNFKIQYSQPPGDYVLDKRNMSQELENFTINASCENLTNAKIVLVSKYKNGQQEIASSSLEIKEDKKVSLNKFTNSFIYNIEQGQMPDSVDFFIYPYNKRPYKWTFRIKE